MNKNLNATHFIVNDHWQATLMDTLAAYHTELVSQDSATPAARQYIAAMLARLTSIPATESDPNVAALLAAIYADLSVFLEQQRSQLTQQLNALKPPLADLELLRDKSQEIIQQLLDKTRQEQMQYLEQVAQFQAGRIALQPLLASLWTLLDVSHLDALLDSYQHQLAYCWTTHGMQQCTTALCVELRTAAKAIAEQVTPIHKVVAEIYQPFHHIVNDESLFAVVVSEIVQAWEQRYAPAEIFNHNPFLVFNEQKQSAKDFRAQWITHIYQQFAQLRQTLEAQLTHALDPLLEYLQAQPAIIEQNLADLQKIYASKTTLQARITELECQSAAVARQLTALRTLRQQLRRASD